MRTPLIDSAIARSATEESQTQSMRRLAQSGGPGQEKKLREACEGFEAMFIQKMWEGMRASLPKEGMMHSREEQFWQGMYDQELGKNLAAAGGVGLADMMMSQLSRDVANTKGFTANRTPMEIDPAPLLPPSPEKPQHTAESGTTTNAVAESPEKKGLEQAGAQGDSADKQNPAQSALADLYSGTAAQPGASGDGAGGTVKAGPPNGQAVPSVPGAPGSMITTPQGTIPNPTPPEIATYLSEFVVQTNAMDAQQGTQGAPLQTLVSGQPGGVQGTGAQQQTGAVMPMQMRAPVQSRYPQVPTNTTGLASTIAQTPAYAPTAAQTYAQMARQQGPAQTGAQAGSQPGAGVPTSLQPGAMQPGMTQSGMTQPGMAQPGTAPTLITPLQNGQPAQPMPLMQSAVGQVGQTGPGVEGTQPPSFVRVSTNIPPSKLRATSQMSRRSRRQTANQTDQQTNSQIASPSVSQTRQSRQRNQTNQANPTGSGQEYLSAGVGSLTTQGTTQTTPVFGGPQPLNLTQAAEQHFQLSGILGQSSGSAVSGGMGLGTGSGVNSGSNVASPMVSPAGTGTPETPEGATAMTVGMNANHAESLMGQTPSTNRRR